MTEPDTTPDTAPADDPGDSLDLPQNLDQARKLRSENKTLRERLKAAEADIETTTGQLAAMRHAEVERLASEHLIDPTDLWSGNTPDAAAFLDENGAIDPGKVTEAAQALTAAKPHLGAEKPVTTPPTQRPIESLRVAASYNDKPTTPTWSDAIRTRTGR